MTMAHMITINEITGNTEAAYANRAAWHNLGEVIEGDLSSGAFLQASKLANWQLELQDVQTISGIKVPDCLAVVRNDTKQILGTVGARYKLFQNEECFGFLDSLLQDGIMKYESAFSMFNSTKVVVVARLPKYDTIADGDTVNRYIMLSTSHDGSSALTFTPTSIRPVCWNTVSLALGNGKSLTRSLRHTENMHSRLDDVRAYLSEFDDAFTLYANGAKLLRAKEYSKEQFQTYVNELFPAPEQDASTRAKNIHAETVQNLRDSFQHPTNNLPGMQGTFWKMFNVVTFAVDHLSNGFHKAENNLDSLLFGKKDALKQRAFELALQMAS